MKTLWIPILLACASMTAQTLSFGTPVRGEYAATYDIRLTGGANLAALQFSLPAMSSPTTVTAIAGPALAAAGKTLSCASTRRFLCVAAGMNANVIPDGVIATVTVKSTSWQNITESFADLLGATPDGDALTLGGLGISLAIPLVSKCDLNADGRVDLSDIAGALGQAQGVAACTTADLTGRHKCDVFDIQRIVNAAASAGCKSGM
jgi:hypothetical protein